jgi:hypothetical protein
MQVNKTCTSSDYYGSFSPSQITATALQSKCSCYYAELLLGLWKKNKTQKYQANKISGFGTRMRRAGLLTVYWMQRMVCAETQAGIHFE